MTRYIFGFVCICALGVMPLIGCGDNNGGGGSGGSAGTGGVGGSGGIDLCEGIVCEDDGNECTEDTCNPADGTCGIAFNLTGCANNSGYCLAGSCALLSCVGVEDGTACFDWSVEPRVCVDGSCQTPCETDADCEDYRDCTEDACLTNGLCADAVLVTNDTPCAGGTCQSGECALEGSVLPCTEQGIRNAIAAGGGPYKFDCDARTRFFIEAPIVIDNDVILDGEGNLVIYADRVFSVSAEVIAELAGLTVHGRGRRGFDDGCIRNQGTLTLTNSTVSNTYQAIGNFGGALALVNSVVSDNERGGIVNHSGSVTLTDTTVSGNTAQGILNQSGSVTLVNTTVSGNGGGGIYNHGTLTLTRSSVLGNTAVKGGGIFSEFGSVTLVNSTVSGNTAVNGGGISCESGILTATNSTVSGNLGNADGGAFWGRTLTLRLFGSTVASNIAGERGSAGYVESDISVEFSGNVIDGECSTANANVQGVSYGHNIESPGNTCGFADPTDEVNVTADDLNLGPLQDNGGPTMTHSLGAGSVAIDQIPEADCVDADGAPLTTDQRGVARPQGPACDVGAFELEVAP